MLVSSVPRVAGAVPADRRTVAVLPVELDGESERARQTVREQLREGLRRGPFVLVEAPEGLTRSECEAPACEQAVAEAAEADFVVRPRVSQRDNVYTVVLEARDPQGELVGSAEDVCEICGLSELGELVAARGASLSKQLEAIAQAPPVVVLQSAPDGAEVYVDARFVGRTPLEHELDPGQHDIEFRAPGYVSQTRTVDAVTGIREDVSVTLGRAQVDERARALVIGGAVTLGLGVALVGAGAPLIAIDSQPYEAECNPDAEGDCERLHDTLAVGAGLTAVGAAAAVTGAALLTVGLIRRKRGWERVSAAASGILVRF